MKSGGWSLLGEEMRLGNLKGHCSAQYQSIRDGCGMVAKGLEGSHSRTGVVEVLHFSCAAEFLCWVAIGHGRTG